MKKLIFSMVLFISPAGFACKSEYTKVIQKRGIVHGVLAKTIE